MMRVCFTAFLLSLTAAVAQPILPLGEIEVGMEGTWDTVVQGDTIETFNLKVLGISKNFVGPRKPVIICEATDADQILNGPVAGMSGSPVYIDGKLIGAYAYGFSWPKSQTIIGVTPIESMMEIVETFPPSPISERYQKAHNNGPVALSPTSPNPAQPSAFDASSVVEPGVDRTLDAHKQLPFPIYVSGVSRPVLEAFESYRSALGIEWAEAPVASSQNTSDWSDSNLELHPGMPVAGVLMGGDFSFSGVGTVTWREGNRILGFGHPFFGAGDVEIPMAGARVITIVRSLAQSFKMTEVGPVVGSIYQDRLTGIAGELGREAPTIDVSYHIEQRGGSKTTYQASLFEHKRLSPLLAAMGLLQSLQTSLYAEEEQTLFITTEIEVQGQAPIRYENSGVGSSGAMLMAVQLLNVVGALTDNPFEFPKVESIHCNVTMVPDNHFSFFDEVIVTSSVPAPGEQLDVTVRVRNNLGAPTVHKLSIPIPIGTKGEVLTLQISDAQQVDPQSNALLRADMDTLSDIVRQINNLRSQQSIFVRLLRKAQGLQLQGDTMYDLPPSITQLYNTPKNAQYSYKTEEIALWETELVTDGVFTGSYRLDIEIK
jgi:hypothetical protein